MPENLIITLAGSGLIAILIGLLTGIFGVGGGFLLTPALIVLLGVSSPVAVGTGLALFLVTSTVGMAKRRGTGTVDFKLAAFIGVGTVLGVLLGHRLLVMLSDHTLTIAGREISAVKYILMWAFLAVLILTAGVFAFDVRHSSAEARARHQGLMQSWRLGPRIRLASMDLRSISIAPLVGIGMTIGAMTGLMGIGGGVVLLPALIYLVGLSTVKAAGTSLALVWISTALAVFLNMKSGNIDLSLLAVMVVGGIAGTYLGTILGLRWSGEKIRAYFIYVVVAALAMVAYELVLMTLGLGTAA